MTSTKTPKMAWEVHDEDLSYENVSTVPPAEQDAIDESLGLQMISIRLQRSLLNNLKVIAEHHKVGYQPLIRDLLNRFAKSELRSIYEEKLQAITSQIADQAPLEAVDDFLQREHRRAQA
jgi:predicted DNA binding CopG/RHH family protein